MKRSLNDTDTSVKTEAATTKTVKTLNYVSSPNNATETIQGTNANGEISYGFGKPTRITITGKITVDNEC